jgi:glycosyltransferase involved in cell wall biosynthesis
MDYQDLKSRDRAMSLKISVVTPSYQHGEYIEQTIRSVIEQDYPFIEYIVMDGGSTDNTFEILKRYESRLKWYSARDRGQSDAINKGFALASGDILAWLNSDDYYAPGALRRVAQFFADNPEAMFVYGDVVGIDRKDHEYGVRLHVRKRQKFPNSDFDILVNQYDFLVQPACFWRASIRKEIGELDLTLRYTMDYEYWMRIAQHHSMYYLPAVLAYERLYGDAKTGSGSLARIEEIAEIARRNGGHGLPHGYRAEAAAFYTVDACRQLVQRNWHSARTQLAQILAQKAPVGRYLRYMAVMIFLGQRGIPTAWLWLNRLRGLHEPRSIPAQPISDGSPPM